MGKTLAEKIFDAHRVNMPFPDTHVLKLDRVFFVTRLQHQLLSLI